MDTKNVSWPRFSRGLAVAALATGCVSVHAENEVITVPGGFTGLLAGYLAPQSLPNSLALVPPVPSADSSALMQGTRRLAVAVSCCAIQCAGRWRLRTLI